jgi:hypothetical protein
MKPLNITFGGATRTRWRAGPAWMALAACAAAGAVFTACQWERLGRELAQMQVTVDASDRSGAARAAQASMRAEEPKVAPEQRAAVNRAVERLNVPWQDLLDQLERAETRDVSLLAIEPDAQRGVVRLTAEAAGPDGMVDYVAGLARQPAFAGVVIRKHQLDQQSPYQPLRFMVELSWRPADAEASR